MSENKGVKNEELGEMIEKYRPQMEKFGREMKELAKKGEEGLIMASKIFKLQMEILGGVLEREKLYYEIGRKISGMLMDGTVEIEGFENYASKLMKLKEEGERKKKVMNHVKEGKK
ncbi:MAG: hypothetical protein HQL30_11410 [Candidatus Omnitrophica bacterium]|nr:hypothetical protein [Candidatus Omnitrophota bacterium]